MPSYQPLTQDNKIYIQKIVTSKNENTILNNMFFKKNNNTHTKKYIPPIIIQQATHTIPVAVDNHQTQVHQLLATTQGCYFPNCGATQIR